MRQAKVAEPLLHGSIVTVLFFSPSLQTSSALVFLHHCTRFIAPVNFCKRRKRRYLKTLGTTSMDPLAAQPCIATKAIQKVQLFHQC